MSWIFRGLDFSKSCSSEDQATDSLQQTNAKGKTLNLQDMGVRSFYGKNEELCGIWFSNPLVAKSALDREMEYC